MFSGYIGNGSTLLAGAGQGQKTAGADAVLASGKTGGGVIFAKNTDGSGVAAYFTFDGTTADATGYLLAAGDSFSLPTVDVSKIRCYSAGSPVLTWAFFT